MDLSKFDIGHNVIRIPSGINLREAWWTIHQALTEFKVPVYKIIGISISSNTNLNPIATSEIEARSCTCENLIDMAEAARKLTFIPKIPDLILEQEVLEGTYRSNTDFSLNSIFDIVEDENISLKTLDPYEEVTLNFILRRCTGVVDAAENQRQTTLYFKSKGDDYNRINPYYPINTVHSLFKHIRLLPYKDGDTDIHYKASNKITPEIFRTLLGGMRIV